MAGRKEHELNKVTGGDRKSTAPGHVDGASVRKAQEWGGGSKASKGPVTEADKRNQNSSAKS